MTKEPFENMGIAREKGRPSGSGGRVCSPELGAGEGLAKGPAGRNDIVGNKRTAVASSELEREGLTIQIGVALPVLSPISGH